MTTPAEGLTLAHELIDAGIPVIRCWPHNHRAKCLPSCDRELDQPAGWQTATADRAALARFRPGVDTLAMVGGHGLDVLDIDAKAGATLADLPDIEHYGYHVTPSGGWHLLVPSTGLGKGDLKAADGRVIGDYVGGTATGAGRLLCYLPGSTRPKYPGRGYTIADPWDIAAAMEAEPDPLMLGWLTGVCGLTSHGDPARPAADTAAVAAWVTAQTHEDGCRYGAAALAGILAGTPTAAGGRHRYFIGAVARVVELIGAGCLPVSALAELRATFAKVKPEGVTDWPGMVAWAVANTDPQPCGHDTDARVNEWIHESGSGVPFGTPDPEADQDTDDQADASTEAPGTSGDPVNTWQRQSLDAVLDGTHVPVVGTLMARSDGVCLLYAGLTHSIHAESESGKSLIVQAEAANVLNTGGRVLYLDFESDAVSVAGRLLDLGADREAIRERFDYRAPETPPAAGTPERGEWLGLLAARYDLAIIDGVTEALALMAPRDTGGDPNERIAGFLKGFPSRIARDTGAAVVLIDHVVKSPENRGRHAIGGQHKMNGLTGAAYTVDVKTQPRRGHIGEVVLRIAKDRPASIRPHCGPPRADRTQDAARVIFDSTGDRLTVRLEAPAHIDADAERPPFRPTHLMEAVSRHLEAHPGEHSRSAIEDALTGNRSARRTALDVLTAEGYVTCREESHGSRIDRKYRHARPYRQADDPKSDAYLVPDPPNGPSTGPEGEAASDPPNGETPLFPHETPNPPNPPQTRPRPAPGESVAAQDTDPPNPPNPYYRVGAGGRVQATANGGDGLPWHDTPTAAAESGAVA